jgi:hypothetical protein
MCSRFSYFANPEFGVEFSIEEQHNQPATRLESKVDDIEILQSREHTDSYAVSSLFDVRIVDHSHFS